MASNCTHDNVKFIGKTAPGNTTGKASRLCLQCGKVLWEAKR